MRRLSLIFGLMLLCTASFAQELLLQPDPLSFANPCTIVEQLRKQGILAMQAGNAPAIEKNYHKLLKINPDDEDAAYHVALAQSWQPGKMDLASANFEIFLKKYPAHKDARIAYANLESWKKNYCKAFAILDSYKTHFGSTKEYLNTRARLLTLVGHCHEALAITTPLLHESPTNYDLLYTHANALYKANRFSDARGELLKLSKIQPNNNDTKELENTFHKLVESLLTSGVNYYQDNQTIKNWTIPLSFDWAINDNTHIIIQGLHEVLTAGKRSGSATINGHSSIYDNSFMAGINWRMAPNVAIIGMVGDLKIQDLSSKFIYWVDAHFALAETANLELLHLHNLYRPYLYPTSPKAVSLGIVEDLHRLKLSLQPFLQTNINMLVGYSTLSDGNHYTHVDFVPTWQFALNSKTDITLGVDLELLMFAKQLHDGYYDPDFHQNYLATASLNYNPIDHLSCGISIGTGIHQDRATEGFRPASHAYASAVYTFSHWEFDISYDYTYQGAAPELPAYQGSSLEARLAAHF